jgi:hypothetical protein
MTKYILSLVLFVICTSSYGQQSDYTICDCCTYSMFQYHNDYDHILSPAIIKTSGIKELVIFTTSRQSKSSKDTVFKIVDPEYKEMIFRFNKDGYVETQIFFNRRGKYHSVYNFTRDNNNKILAKTFHYLDSIGNRVEDFLPEKWIYVYSDNHLIKVKKLGAKFDEQPDNKSDFTAYDYDIKGRIITETRQLYYDWTEPSFYQSKTKYNDTTTTSIEMTRDKKKLFSIVKTKFTKTQKLLNEKFYDGRNNKLLQETIFTYNNNEQLITFQVKNSGMGTECPEGGNFTDTYSYTRLQLIDSIKHKYRNTICELRFVYK